jgi:Mlc titration factor MtfA (ptsG expression regulator)
MFADYRRKRALRRDGFPAEWRVIIESNVVHWRVLGGADRELLEDYVVRLVTEKRWEAARGFALTDEIQVTIAAQAALLVLGIGYEAYRGVGTIIVHPTTMQLTGERGGPISGTRTNAPLPVLGVAHYQGPVIIAWDSARAGARHPERGHNVVYHEFAHKIDMLDGLVDGTPPLERDDERTRWIEVCTAEYQALRNGTDDGFLDGYAAVNPGEFFAVVTEAFFDLPREMEAAKPDLYGVLRDFYRQDPARVAREHN